MARQQNGTMCIVGSEVIKIVCCFDIELSAMHHVRHVKMFSAKTYGVLAENYFQLSIMQRYCYSSPYFNTHYCIAPRWYYVNLAASPSNLIGHVRYTLDISIF